MILLLVLSVIPGIVLIIQNGINLHTSSGLLEERIMIKENVHFSMEIGRLIHCIQYERGVTSLYNSAMGEPKIHQELIKSYTHTDAALNALRNWKHSTQIRVELQTKGNYHEHLRHFRNDNRSHSILEIVTFFSADIEIFIDWMVSSVKEEKHSNNWSDLVAYNMLINGKESVGIERALGAHFFINGALELSTLLWYKGTNEMALQYLKKFSEYSSYGKPLLRIFVTEELKFKVDSMRDELLVNATGEYSLRRGLIWMDTMTSYINELDVINGLMVNYIKKKIAEEISSYNLDVVLDIVILVLTMIVVPLLLIFIYKVAKKVDTIRKHLEEKTVDLEMEQKRTETLLSQLVPGKIARKIHSSHVVPEVFNNVTVMVSDISNFEAFLAKSTPNELLEMVNTVFEIIERRLSAYNVSKIGAVGNLLYMASGLNQDRGVYHLVNIADFALDTMERVRQVKRSHLDQEPVKLAIAINIGTVIAGIVNNTLPRYCLYGKTVIDANEILSACHAGRIQVNEITYKLLTTNGFSLKPWDDVYRMMGKKQPKYYVLLGKNETDLVHVDLEAECADV